MFPAITYPDMIRLYRRFGSLGLLLLLGAAYMVSKRPAANPVPGAATMPDAAVRAHIVDEVEPLYRALFPNREIMRFTLAFGTLHPHKMNETRGWMVECYDNAGNEIAHGLWDEQGRRHISVSVDHPRLQSRSLSFLTAKVAAQTARDWLYRTKMAVPQSTADSATTTQRSGEIWHVTVRVPDGVTMIWMNAHNGEVHQALRADGLALCAGAEISPSASSCQSSGAVR